jgi:glycerophosphoryl diester phosphodiesterase
MKKKGVRIIAPPMFALLAVNASGEIVPSQYALDIRGLGFDIITWTFERADLRQGAAAAGFYYLFDPQNKAVKKDSDMYKRRWMSSRARSGSSEFSPTGRRQ